MYTKLYQKKFREVQIRNISKLTLKKIDVTFSGQGEEVDCSEYCNESGSLITVGTL